MKLNPNGLLAHFRARLIAKGYSQVYRIDYHDIFLPVAKLTPVRVLVYLAATHHWPLHQLDVIDVFLNDVLDNEVLHEAITWFYCSGRVRKDVQAEEVPKWIESITEILVWMIYLYCSGFWSFSFSERSFCILVTSSREEVTLYSVCGWYYYWWWCTKDCWSEMLLAEVFLDKRHWIFAYFLGIEVARSMRRNTLFQRKCV